MSTITTIAAGDTLSASRSVINTNFSNLNTDKLEATDTVTITGTWTFDAIIPTLGGDISAGGNDINNLGNIVFKTGAAGGTVRTGTANADKFTLQAYDVDGSAYVTVAEADAGNDVTLNLFTDYLEFEDATDNTKQVVLSLSGATTGTKTTLTFSQTANRVITLPDATDTLVGKATTDTFTNKSIDLANNTVTGTLAEFNTAVSDANFASLTGTETLTNKTLSGATLSGVIDAGGATSFEIPNGAAPTVNAAGEIAVDTTITDFTGLIKYHDGVEELAVLAVPVAELTSPSDGDIPTYNAADNEFKLAQPAASAGLVLLDTQTASASSSLDFTSSIDSTYDLYVFQITDLVMSDDNSQWLAIRVDTDGGASFESSSYVYTGVDQTSTDTTADGFGSNGDAEMELHDNPVGAGTSQSFSGEIKLYKPSGTSNYKLFMWDLVLFPAAGASGITRVAGSGYWSGGTGAINAVQFLPTANTITSGTIRMYGIVNS